MKNKGKILTMLGFAQKSGKLVSGESAVKAKLIKNQIYFLIIAEDLGENRQNYWTKIAEQNNIPYIIISNKVELGLAIGLSPRSLLGITDRHMAKSMQ
jgi:ribosomal protein L7Ae-like RNA K-turn-binding protein